MVIGRLSVISGVLLTVFDYFKHQPKIPAVNGLQNYLLAAKGLFTTLKVIRRTTRGSGLLKANNIPRRICSGVLSLGLTILMPVKIFFGLE